MTSSPRTVHGCHVYTMVRCALFIFQHAKKNTNSHFLVIHTVWAFISRHAGTSNTHDVSPTCCFTCRQSTKRIILVAKYSMQTMRIAVHSMLVLLSMCAHGSTIASPTFYGKQKYSIQTMRANIMQHYCFALHVYSARLHTCQPHI